MAREVLAEMAGSDAQKALRFVLDQDAIHGAVIGLAEMSHLQEAIQATQMDPLSSSVTEALKNSLEPGLPLRIARSPES